MTDHTHSQYVAGCYRCDLSRDEVASGYITEEMVEVAAKTRWDYARAESGDTTEWDMRYPSFREFDIDAMRAALEAVVPDIIQQAKAEAWDEGHRMSDLNWRHIYDGHPCDEGEMCPSCCQPNPYERKDRR